VFLANDRRLRRKVALKRLLSSRHDRSDERARILREARAAAPITHPNVAAIHDVVDASEGVFIVMEYVEGESLSARLRRERVPLGATLSIGRQLASALAAAHAKGVIHRDLKPANVQVMRDGTAKILDFGIAQAIVASSSATTVDDTRGARLLIAGTPGYMSPEQTAGALVDERSDIFSLGVVLFEMIAGRRPFAGVDFRNQPAAAQAARLDVAAPGTPADVVDLVGKALEIDVLRRYQSALEIDTALAAAQARTGRLGSHGREVLAGDSVARVARAAAFAIALTVALVVVGALTTVAFNRSLQRPDRFAEEPLWRYLWLGFQANFMLLIIGLVVAALKAGMTFLTRVARLIGPFDRLLSRLAERVGQATLRLGLDDPMIFGQCLAAFGLVALVVLAARHQDLMRGYLQWVNLAPADQLLPLSPGSWKGPYRLSVDLLLIALGAGLWRLLRLRRRAPDAGGSAAIGMVGAVMAIVLLIHILPYRILFQNVFEQVSVAGIRCYLINERDREVFLFCPESAPPRSHVINLDRVSIDRSGRFESMFTPPFGLPSSPSR
jgi:hypothetical protein